MARDSWEDRAIAGSRGMRGWILPILFALLLLAGAFYLYRTMTAVHGVAVEAPSPTVVAMLPPPPPPPPPPPKAEPQLKQPEPSAAPTPAPTPAPSAPAPLTMNAEPQAGVGGIASGSGAGGGAIGGTGTCLTPPCGTGPPGGGGISDAFYGRGLSSALQQRVQRENRVNRQVFTDDFLIWVSADGRVTKVDLVRGSGDGRRDQILQEVIGGTTGLDAPPSSFRFPQRITVRGRRALG